MQMGKHAWADSKLWVVLFFILQTLIVIFTFRIESIFAALAGFVGIAAYLMIDQRKYRALSFIYMALWVANGIINFYPIALISDSLSVVSVSIAIYRYDLCKNARKLQKAEKERAKNEEIEKNQD